MAKGATEERKKVDAVERALSILDAFSENETRLSLTEIAKHTGLYPSTTLRLAGSLEYWGYLRRDADGHFRLGPTVLRLGSLYRDSFDLGEVIRPALKRLSEASGETAAFYVREGDDRVCLYRHHSKHPLRHHIEEGVRLPLDRGAGGHVLVAYTGGDAEVHRQVRADGYRASFGERDPETAAVSVPVFGAGGVFLGALTLVGTRTRITDEVVPGLIDLLQGEAAQLRTELDGRRAPGA
ncbi:IclR family transcriptional regulator [Kocuria rosea]|uniref:Glycerol operon regulatory protein n=1 Tax=Kocuria rosea TaxID=1275 RepID=A0A4R5Y4V0_KOCRO|nr:IclR family transcriptional regulator [Kocuria rosea]TDL38152.1 IclR family transcriptional regulator [Kocuria rosea]